MEYNGHETMQASVGQDVLPAVSYAERLEHHVARARRLREEYIAGLVNRAIAALPGRRRRNAVRGLHGLDGHVLHPIGSVAGFRSK